MEYGESHILSSIERVPKMCIRRGGESTCRRGVVCVNLATDGAIANPVQEHGDAHANRLSIRSPALPNNRMDSGCAGLFAQFELDFQKLSAASPSSYHLSGHGSGLSNQPDSTLNSNTRGPHIEAVSHQIKRLSLESTDSLVTLAVSESGASPRCFWNLQYTSGMDDGDGDYANIWDASSGSMNRSFSANQEVMRCLLHAKGTEDMVGGKNTLPPPWHLVRELDTHGCHVSSVRYDRLSDNYIQTSDRCTEMSDRSVSSIAAKGSHPKPPEDKSSHLFNMEKFINLKAKAESLDLQLTDFDYFSDLKHSLSLLDLSAAAKSLKPDCKYSCHEDCESLIVKECSGARAALTEEDDSCLEAGPDVDDRDSGYSGSGGTAGFTLTKEEICSRIKAYNERKGSAAVAMTLPTHERDTFQGCIQVCICIDRPISMSLSSRPTSIYDVMHRNEELSPTQSPENTMSPVLLPRDSVMSLHINSANTSSEVVGILLNKFRITDNPKGFALFEQTIENDKEVKLRKIADQEKPLVNFLRWSTENISETKRFVLKENDSGEIMWEAFSIPELHNFLRMLEAEELEYHQQIKSKYNGRKKQMELQLSEHFCERPCQQL